MEFHTAHTSIAGSFGVVGATGIRIEEFIRYTNQFTSE